VALLGAVVHDQYAIAAARGKQLRKSEHVTMADLTVGFAH
jgi:hypothetical protein